MTFKATHDAMVGRIDPQAAATGVRHADRGERTFQRNAHHFRQQHADDPTMAHQQNPFAGGLLLPVQPTGSDAFAEIAQRLTARRRAGNRITPEPAEGVGGLFQYVGGRPTFPLAKMQFPEPGFNVQGKAPLFSQFPGKHLTSQQGRGQDHVPLVVVVNGAAHLLPTGIAQRVVLTASEHRATGRFAMADQIKQGGCVSCHLRVTLR